MWAKVEKISAQPIKPNKVADVNALRAVVKFVGCFVATYCHGRLLYSRMVQTVGVGCYKHRHLSTWMLTIAARHKARHDRNIQAGPHANSYNRLDLWCFCPVITLCCWWLCTEAFTTQTQLTWKMRNQLGRTNTPFPPDMGGVWSRKLIFSINWLSLLRHLRTRESFLPTHGSNLCC